MLEKILIQEQESFKDPDDDVQNGSARKNLVIRGIFKKLIKEAQIQADYMKQFRKNVKKSPLERWILEPIRNSYDWIKKTWLPKSKFRIFIIGPIIIILLSFTTLGPVYVYGHVNKFLGGKNISDEVRVNSERFSKFETRSRMNALQ